MKTLQAHIQKPENYESDLKPLIEIDPKLVLVFGSVEYFESTGLAALVSKKFPKATVIGCSTAGEISNDGVYDKTLVVTGSHFSKSEFKSISAHIESMDTTFRSGSEIGKGLAGSHLKAIFVLGRGLDINGSALIEGIRSAVGKDVVITGGLAGDAGRFQKTYTILNGEVAHDRIVAFGIYGENVKVSFGSMGGWEAFGPIRVVTKSKANVLYELDGQPALDIYKKYLGEKAKDLPASALLFPFQLLNENNDSMGIVRTILAVDEKEKSVTLAGDIPMNGRVRLMHTNNEGLVQGAKEAAEAAKEHAPKHQSHQESLGILISCVGRKLVMGPDIEEELEAVQEVFGKGNVTGFYSYGEICPLDQFSECKLHNQTMTITYFSEAS